MLFQEVDQRYADFRRTEVVFPAVFDETATRFFIIFVVFQMGIS